MENTSSKLNKYILPNITLVKSFQDNITGQLNSFTAYKDKVENIVSIDDMLNLKRTFIIGEPGYGKSRLLKEILNKSECEKYKCCFLDLKKIKNNLEDYIKKMSSDLDFERHLKKNKTHFITKGFELQNSEKNILFLDALDEVHSDIIPLYLEQVNQISIDFPKLKIFISCRTHHLNRYQTIIHNFDFKYAELKSFNFKQTIEFLKFNCPSLKKLNDEEIMTSVRSAKFYSLTNQKNTFSTPRYIEILSSLINDKGFTNVINLSRCEIFELFIFERLKVESAKKEGYKQSYASKIPYIKQFLERLALVMEIQRENHITKDDFIVFQLDTNMNLNQQILLEVFFDGTILKDNEETLEFDNSEFQEYLAAKALTRLGRIEQLVYDVAIEQNLNDIYPSWVNVLGFIVELNPELLLPLVNYASWTDNPHLFDLINFPKPSLFENRVNEKSEIFTIIFNYYLSKKKLFSFQIENSLHLYYNHESHYKKLFNSKNDDTYLNEILKINSTIIIDKIIGNEDFNLVQKNKIKEILLDQIDSNLLVGDTLQRYSLKALSTIVSIEELKPLIGLSDKLTRSFRKILLKTHNELDSNHPNTIHLILKDFVENKTASVLDLERINSNEGFKFLFNEILNDNEINPRHKRIIFLLNDNGFYNEENSSFFDNLKNIWDKDVEVLVIKILLRSCYDHNNYNSRFFDNLCKTLDEVNENATRMVMQLLQKEELEKDDYDFWIAEFISKIIKPNQFTFIRDKSIEIFSNDDFARWILIQSSDSEVRKLIKIHYPEVYLRGVEFRKEKEKSDLKRTKEREGIILLEHERFISCLDKSHEHVIFDYYKNHGTWQEKLTDKQKEKLKSIVEDILIKYDPRDFEIEKNKIRPITTYFENAVRYSREFKLDLTPHRQKIISLIPFVFEMDFIFEIIQDISIEEFQSFFDWISKKQISNLFRLDNIIALCRNENVKSSKPFLEKIIQHENVETHNKINSINLIFSWGETPKSFFQKIFDENCDAEKWSSKYRISLAINELFLENEDEAAVEWRINEIFNLKYELKRDRTGIRGIKPVEGFGEPLQKIHSPKFYQTMLSFLERSFEVLENKPLLFSFAKREVWHTITVYFKNLKSFGVNLEEKINDLNSLLKKYESINDVTYFAENIKSIKNEYLLFFGKPTSFHQSVKKYNQIKAQQYLDISYPEELFELIKRVIDNDLRNWVHQGFYGFIKDLNSTNNKQVERERIIQKTIVTQLENFLYKSGLRKSDISELNFQFYREVEKLNGDKVDLIISYGSIGAIMVEIKRANNSDLSKGKLVEYRQKKFLPYMNETNCKYGIYLIFKDSKSPKDFGKKISQVREVYSKDKNISIIGIDCIV